MEWNNMDSFEMVDPFNPQNYIKGDICVSMGDTYGALRIFQVNGEDVDEEIYCTPKMYYPMDKQGNYQFPKNVQNLESYEKIDGSNVFAFIYHNTYGDAFLSFKLRMRPFMSNSRFGDFLDMWNELFPPDRLSILKDYMVSNELGIAFELWGNRNPHLINYDKSLEATILFARHKNKIVPISEMPLLPEGFPTSDLHIGGHDMDNNVLEDLYRNVQVELENNLVHNQDGTFDGEEGKIWYVQQTDNIWRQYKLKPFSIEEIHWAAGGLGVALILQACHKSFELKDEPVVGDVVNILLEDYGQLVVDNAKEGIKKYFIELVETKRFHQEILDLYNNFDDEVKKDKRLTMRKLSGHYDKILMSKVYGAVAHNFQEV